ncbi:hypothetical protein ABQE69_08880 [Mycolicibacillus trivialis]
MTHDVSLQRPASPDGPWPPPYPPQPPPRRGLGAIIIAAAVIIAAGLVAAALVMNRSDNREDAPVAQPPTTSATVAAEDSSTCQAWQSIDPSIQMVIALPPGWNWDTPNIDTLISNRNAAIDKALDLFEPQIADDPADVAAAAHTLVNEHRMGNKKLEDHTYVGADAVAINEAATRLSRLCGMSTG